jgi:UDP-N-acetylmuramate dehydrogenase
MTAASEAISRLESISNLTILRDEPLALHTRFGIGGPALIFVETADENSFHEALLAAREGGLPWVVIGEGSNLVVSDEGFPGVVLRFTSGAMARGAFVHAQAGAHLQTLVDFTIDQGLGNLHTMTGIPGSVGAAVYGNAGAYGHSISESVASVRFFDSGKIRAFDNAACQFQYRESIFKRHKDWIIHSVSLDLAPAPAEELRSTANGILKIRNEKYPPTMKCAGSIFKNLILSELPDTVQRQVPGRVVREGKVPSAYFLEEVGAKGIRNGGIEVATYHANLIYNTGAGTARELREVISDLKERVVSRFQLTLEEEVQYVGFGET